MYLCHPMVKLVQFVTRTVELWNLVSIDTHVTPILKCIVSYDLLCSFKSTFLYNSKVWWLNIIIWPTCRQRFWRLFHILSNWHVVFPREALVQTSVGKHALVTLCQHILFDVETISTGEPRIYMLIRLANSTEFVCHPFSL